MGREHYDLARMRRQAEGSLELRRHMVLEAFERQGRRPCLGCGRRPAEGVGTFLLTEEEVTELAVRGGRVLLFPLCATCERRLDDSDGLREGIARAVLERVAAGMVDRYPGASV